LTDADDKILAHLNAFSISAIQTLAAARVKAGQRGSNVIDVGDLLFGIVLEDQGMMGNLISEMHGTQGSVQVLHSPSHSPFFPPATASDILTRTESLLPQSEPFTHTIEVPLSPDIERTFDGAKDVRNMFHHKQIEPLHLLAAVLSQESSQYVELLREAGITREMVMERLRAAEGEEGE
jgi:Clp amino terminal domain, pathogenicity island component